MHIAHTFIMNISTRRKKKEFATGVHQEQIVVEQIVHPQIQEQIVEGVMEIPQERLPDGIEEQIEDVLVPQSVCYISPTPVIQDVTPAPSILYPASKDRLCDAVICDRGTSHRHHQ